MGKMTLVLDKNKYIFLFFFFLRTRVFRILLILKYSLRCKQSTYTRYYRKKFSGGGSKMVVRVSNIRLHKSHEALRIAKLTLWGSIKDVLDRRLKKHAIMSDDEQKEFKMKAIRTICLSFRAKIQLFKTQKFTQK